MPKPSLIAAPKKLTLYLPSDTIVRGRAVASLTGSSLSQLVTDLINTKADSGRKVRVHADFSSEEYADIAAQAEQAGQSVEDFIRTATYQLLG